MRQIFVLATILSAFALAIPAASAAGNGKFCLKGPGEQMNCTYQTMAECTKAKKGTQSCVSNPSSTTGSGTSDQSNSMKK